MFLSAQPIYSIAETREIETRYVAGSRPTLMERAGRAAAEEAVRLISNRPGPILIACGPGNNGGDGFVVARHLLHAGREIEVAFVADASKLPADAAKARADFLAAGGHVVSDLPAAPAQGWALVVDALFGIGLQRPIEGRYASWIQTLNAQTSLRLALDIPSGLDADSGQPLGATFCATHTATFIALKPGLLTNDGPDYCGQVNVHRLDLDAPAILSPRGMSITPALFQQHLLPRRRNTHKGLFGSIGILGGNRGMLGAALLAGRAAMWLGAGRVHLGLLHPQAPSVDTHHPELMLHTAAELPLAQLNALAIGPGLGNDAEAAAQLSHLLGQSLPLVLDADALNLIGADPALQQQLSARDAPDILTPHPAEAARLLGITTAAVQSDRLGAALEIARRYRASIVLKGSGSIIATADGRWFINSTGHPGMASAGMGDVLTGLTVSLLAQGWPAEQALIAAVHLHGAAADRLAREGIGPVGLSASETIDAARGVFNGWLIEAQS
ncbi:MAG: NAD(P)H-hydrate dehydratase [Thauera sp.]|jgi:hydroxyethylthiazole kinase-like uncharacterized protein yjeF|nr:NAD(P)H-hydrate dehydratase [Thauera sp.]